ncbi:hypothetical protein RvY_07160 [Ramazzottius varieornatus]|uniref:Uncharacterized protein n=1 Tax=Ramazzottius varieornatus TaxID=947166 RepID=A0A1D1V1E3_RAMVA|nr:hypothetical protein RvY_07160 [Ramazzottius varieornatus]
MNNRLVTLVLGSIVLLTVPALLTSAPVQSVEKPTPVLRQLNDNVKAENGISEERFQAGHHFGTGGIRRADPFAEYGHIRFGKRAPPSFGDYGHLRFGRRAVNGPNFKEYGHLRFGRSTGETVDEADIYKHDFDDINDVE